MALVKNLSKSPRGFNAYVRGRATTVEIPPGEERDIALIGRDSPVLTAWRAAHDVEVGPVNLTDSAHAPSVADAAATEASNTRENEIVSGLKAEVEARTAECKSLRIEHETIKAQMVTDMQAATARVEAAQTELAHARAGQHAEVDRLNAEIEALRRTLAAAAAPGQTQPLAPPEPPAPPAPPAADGKPAKKS